MSNTGFKKAKSIKNLLGIGRNKKTGIHLKNTEELEKDYLEIIEKIKDKSSTTIIDLISGKDIKYYIEYNQLDYILFKMAIKHRREEFLCELDDSRYNFNKNTFLIEFYESIQKNLLKQESSNPEDSLNDDDFNFMIGFENGKLMNVEKCKLDFYYLLLSKKYDMAMQILKYDYSNNLKEELNEVLIDIQDNYLKKLLISQDLAYDCLKIALERNIDGIAYEIMTNANLFLDETILELAVSNDCELFLEFIIHKIRESWENNLKFGNVHNYFAPKIPFVRYIEVMINHKKYFMACEAIKHWSDTYKQENIFELLVSRECEELAADMIERASEMNFKIEFSNELFLDPIIKKMYFLLKAIIGKPMYKKFLMNEDIQQALVDPMRKGHTILSAIECYNMIEDHLLMIKHVENACKVLLEFSRSPKQFSFCKYPLLLCVLVTELMTKLQRRFPVYESLFNKLYNIYHNAGKLFTEKIKDEPTLIYHLSTRDLRDRTTLQIVSENRLHEILSVDEVKSAIDKNWSGSAILYGLADISSFEIIRNYELDDEINSFVNISKAFNQNKAFYFNYYSYRDITLIRFCFKEAMAVVIVLFYQFLIYFVVSDEETAQSIDLALNGKYKNLNTLCVILSLFLIINKINSIVFFTFVKRWYIEQDSLLLELIFIAVLVFHFFNLKNIWIPEYDMETRNFFSGLLLSGIIGSLWFRVIYNLRVTKAYGGFLRVVYVILSQIANFLLIFFSFCAMCSGIFTLLFHKNEQFSGFFQSFLTLFAATCNNYTIANFKYDNMLCSIFFAVFIVVSILMLINLLIAFLSELYNDYEDKIESEQSSTLIRVYEYLKYDETYGIFKFLFAPFSFFSTPFELILLFIDDKKYWNEVFCKILYSQIALIYFFLFIIQNAWSMPIGYLNMYYRVIMSSNTYYQKLKKIAFLILFSPFPMGYYFILDLYNFWYYAYKEQKLTDDNKEEHKASIMKVKVLFSKLLPAIVEKVNKKENKRKSFPISELITSWISRSYSVNARDETDNNIAHKRSVIKKKYKDISSMRKSHYTIISKSDHKVSYLLHYGFIVNFLQKFGDRSGDIDKDLAKYLFPKKSYYDDEYFEYLFYFQEKIFRKLVTELTYKGNEKKKELNKLQRVHQDLNKIVDKFKSSKIALSMMSNNNISVLNTGIGLVNKIFAILENNLLDLQANQLFSQIGKVSGAEGATFNTMGLTTMTK